MNTARPRLTEQGVTVVQAWPEQMRAETAAAFCDERSVDSFLRSVGTLYPRPKPIRGKGLRWLRADLEQAVRRIHRGDKPEDDVTDAGDVL